ncbi:MAG: hypothetical protein ACFFA6_15945 [Promethearchaeota archaeon]
MKSIKDKAEIQEFKKNLRDDLKYYKSFIVKKLEINDINSALEKTISAITLIEDHRDYFDITNQLVEFRELNRQINTELRNYRRIYLRRYNNLLKERINESNLENFMRLLAMLKNEVDKNLINYNLKDIHDNINKYFVFIKRIYEILSCCNNLNYHDVSGKILDFVKDLKSENFPNLKFLISDIYQSLLTKRLTEISKEYEKIPISSLSKKLAINQEGLINFINLIKKNPKSPIKDYNSVVQEVIFKKSKTI